MARIEARVTAFGPTDPYQRTATAGTVEAHSERIEIHRQRRGAAGALDRCDVYLGPPERAQLALDLVVLLPTAFLMDRLGVGDGATQLIRLLRRLVETGGGDPR